MEKIKYDELLKEIKIDYDYYTQVINEIMKTYTESLDTIMEQLQLELNQQEQLPDQSLEKYLLELNSALYFLSSKVEMVGIKDDISKLIQKEAFNNSYLDNREKDSDRKNKLTVAELTAIAEEDSKSHSIINSIYNRVYKQIKNKIDAAYDMLDSLRKLISKRMQEVRLNYNNQNIMNYIQGDL